MRLRKIIKMTQRSQNDNYIKTSKNKSKATWSVINKSKSNLPKEPIQKLKVDNKYITCPVEIANTLNNYFIDDIQNYNYVNNKRSIKIKNNLKSIFLGPVTSDKVLQTINSLKNKNSVGFDDICTKVIKYTGSTIAHAFA